MQQDATKERAEIDREFVEAFRRPVSQGNWVRDINPLIAFLVLGCLAIIPIWIEGLIAPLAMCAAFVAISLLAGVGRPFIPGYLKLFLAVGLILFILRAAFEPGDLVLFEFGPLSPTWEGVQSGARFALVVMVLCGALTLYAALIPAKYLMLALEQQGLTPRATYVLLASFQAITDLGKNVRIVMDAQKSRGIETEGSILTRSKAFFPIIAPAFLAAMNQTEERAVALDARAFSSKTPHTRLISLRGPRPWEFGLLLVAVAGMVVSIMGAYLSWL
jgi:energy-coupling factor transport system permease protein